MQKFTAMIDAARTEIASPEPLLAGNSVAAHALRQMVSLAARSTSPVQLAGGQAGDHIRMARAIHDASAQCADPFVDAANSRLEEDHFAIDWQGTLFLGNVGRLDSAVQAALLDWMDSDCGLDVRVITTYQETALADASLDARLAAFAIPCPALNSRREDISAMLQRLWAQSSHPLPPIFERSAWSVLMEHDWRGEFDELHDFADKASRLYGGRRVGMEQIRRLLGYPSAVGLDTPGFSLKQHLAQEEKLFLIEALLRSDGVVQAAASRAGLKRTTFLAKMKRYGLAPC
jgi:DNA-binding NtrC family response regulator